MGRKEKAEKPKKILVVDDDLNICFTVKAYLSSMDYQVESVNTGIEGLEKAISGKYDAIILDVMLPGMDGFEVLKKIRRTSSVPVIMLTSRDDLTDKVVGLEIGADDYLPKLFSERELLARLRAVIRSRSYRVDKGEENRPDEMLFRELIINRDSRVVTFAGKELELTPIEYRLLLALAESAGKVVSRDQLLDSLTGRDYEVFDRAIDNHVSSLRKKLGDNPANPQYIKTIRSVGYMFIPTGKNLS